MMGRVKKYFAMESDQPKPKPKPWSITKVSEGREDQSNDHPVTRSEEKFPNVTKQREELPETQFIDEHLQPVNDDEVVHQPMVADDLHRESDVEDGDYVAEGDDDGHPDTK